ncbi:molybdenum cofactor guanylyltransferase [uncultured Chitinophaga sp.]|uniref:molybdenum cofactor guanylyltransferase n=1 Tax=uncultured Chitinophaga sp. TaxID=339340 RepID=UPI0025ED113B|nr:molybdenum cofactor guanylyltransferase [uncultured Chitinophaga sp.]
MRGIVLCGGSSSRMGSDKGLLLHNGIPWAQHAGEKLITLGIPVSYAINKEQESSYAAQRITPTFIDNNTLDIGGPLRGIFTAHLLFPKDDLFILACDLRDMHTDILRNLLTSHQQDVTVYTGEMFDEPLCGIYTHTALSTLCNLYHQGKLLKHSMQYALRLLDVQRLAIPAEWVPGFRNYNSLSQ